MANGLGIDLSVVPYLVAYDGGSYDLTTRITGARRNLAADASEAHDLAVHEERENLAQALILRLMTARGELAELGHAAYGSRLYELIGRRKTEALRNLCRAFVLEVVAQEPRVEDQAVELVFHPQQETLSSFVFTLAVSPRVGDGEPLGLTLEVGL